MKTLLLARALLLVCLVAAARGVTQRDREAICENKGYDRSECESIACCGWDDGQCWAGDGECTGAPSGGGGAPSDVNGGNAGEYNFYCDSVDMSALAQILQDCQEPCNSGCPDRIHEGIEDCPVESKVPVIDETVADIYELLELQCGVPAPAGRVPSSPTENMAPCLDEHATRLSVTALPDTAPSAYKRLYCQYTAVVAPNGKPIEIFGQKQLSSLQLYRARSVLEFYLSNVAGSEYGADKSAIADAMADNAAKLDMPDGAHEQPGAGRSLVGQELYESETPVEGSKWYMDNDWSHRDAAFEEILHLVHDNGIGIDKAGYRAGAAPEYQAEIRSATSHALPTWFDPPGQGLWAEDPSQRGWINELAQEGSLTQEYLASVVDSYYGLWGPYFHSPGGMWGMYVAKTRAEIETKDPMGWDLMGKFFHPYLNWMVMLDPQLDQDFKMFLDTAAPYTHKSQYITDATLMGSNDVSLHGNERNNRLGPNSGLNTLDGRGGTDTAVFQGNCEDYEFVIGTTESPDWRVSDRTAGRDGITVLKNIETIEFKDGTVPVSALEDQTGDTLCGSALSPAPTSPSPASPSPASTPTSAPAPTADTSDNSSAQPLHLTSISYVLSMLLVAMVFA